MKQLLLREVDFRGEDVGLKFVRKFYPYYVNGFNGASRYRGELVLLENLSETLTVTDKYSIQQKRFRWIDDIENKQLYNLIVQLPERDKEFLTFLVTGYNRAEIAEIRGVKIQSINKKISKFKKLFSTVVSASVVNITNN